MASQLDYPNEPVAIIGSGCRFPGEASSPSKLWDLLQKPRDVLREIPASRFNAEKFYHPDSLHHGTSNVRHSYTLSEDHYAFDTQFFGIKPIEASAIDPQQRILLETTYEALESAGIAMETLQGSKTGVFVGVMTEDYSSIIGRDIGNIPTYLASGTARSILSNRLSYFFDLHGPSMTIDTACSSSLVALHQAVQSLRNKESCICIVAGCNLLLGPDQYVAESKLQMLSPSGRSRMWDEDADGYARGDGFGVLVLKTLSKALEDQDSVECIIRETGINQDGRTQGITMPSPKAQTDLIRDTFLKAGLDLSKSSDRPQYFEAHGTGESFLPLHIGALDCALTK
jgi:hybrid polyketide synthase/nonribosomal peptide synthetase ACE1